MKIGRFIIETEEQRAQAFSAHWKNATHNAGVKWLEEWGFSPDWGAMPLEGNFDYSRPDWGFIIYDGRPHPEANINGLYWRPSAKPKAGL